MDEFQGTIISQPFPSDTEFNFVIDKGSVSKGDFIEIEGTNIIARITGIYMANRYFERADSVKQFHRSGLSIEDRFPVKDWEYLVAQARQLGRFENGIAKRVRVPPRPGSKVKHAKKDVLAKFLGFKDDGVKLGKLENTDLAVSLGLTKTFQKHLALLAISGAGKSYTSAVLLEELLDRKKEDGQVALIVFDVHGEYGGFGEETEERADYSKKTTVYDASKIRISASEMGASQYSEFLGTMSSAQKRELSKIIKGLREKVRKGDGLFNIDDLINYIEADEAIKANTKTALIGWMEELRAYHLFTKVGEPKVEELAQAGRLSVIDFSKIINLKKKQIIVTYFLRKLFAMRRSGKIPPTVVFIEEAHNFAREGVSSRDVVSRPVIETIAREGRKFGMSLCLISQRPIQLSTTALSQCNTQIIMRVTNPYDLKHIGESSEGIDSSSLDTITSLRVGEALIVGEAVNYPVFVQVRERKSVEGKTGMKLEQMAKEFSKKEKEASEDVKAFM